MKLPIRISSPLKLNTDAIIEPCRDLEAEGVEITFLPVDAHGAVNPEDVKNAIKENTVLVFHNVGEQRSRHLRTDPRIARRLKK